MSISERIFSRLTEINMNQSEFSRQTGISTSTINDWKHKKTNPSADKMVCICKVLGISLTDLLCDEEDTAEKYEYFKEETYIVEIIRNASFETKKRMITYLEKFVLFEGDFFMSHRDKRNISVIRDIDGNHIVMINDIRFKGKRSVDWKDVRDYLKEYVGDFYQIAATGDVIYIGADLPKEYTGSKYTNSLKGINAKAKANATQGIPELIEIAVGKYYKENIEEKHRRDAQNGWYRYDSRFAVPVYDDKGEIERYNVFHASMLIRHANDDKMYLYDILDIKKETSNSLSL